MFSFSINSNTTSEDLLNIFVNKYFRALVYIILKKKIIFSSID